MAQAGKSTKSNVWDFTGQGYAWDLLVLVFFGLACRGQFLLAFDSGSALDYLLAFIFVVLIIKRVWRVAGKLAYQARRRASRGSI
ncbi:MAG TPA: hypothetical protein VJP80_08035 [Candidatus Saccharimonadales bacterium]|nr:hypothetical protein [Candidatus Saccharimonadales bacterium]